MPTSASDDSDSGASISGHEYASRFASFAAPEQQVALVQIELKQLHPDA